VATLTESEERAAVRIAGLLVVLGFVSSYVLWTLDTAYASGESLFALYLSIDLISFAMIAYVYRVTTDRGNFSRTWMIAGFCLMFVLMSVGFAYANPPY